MKIPVQDILGTWYFLMVLDKACCHRVWKTLCRGTIGTLCFLLICMTHTQLDEVAVCKVKYHKHQINRDPHVTSIVDIMEDIKEFNLLMKGVENMYKQDSQTMQWGKIMNQMLNLIGIQITGITWRLSPTSGDILWIIHMHYCFSKMCSLVMISLELRNKN